jgi:signal transduction histidine kinase
MQLPADARLAIYRTAQESLTNVRKHALATPVAIRLCYAPGETVLTVENEGSSRPASLQGGGHRLEGMRERTALARGRLDAGPTPTGFRVCLWLPI